MSRYYDFRSELVSGGRTIGKTEDTAMAPGKMTLTQGLDAPVQRQQQAKPAPSMDPQSVQVCQYDDKTTDPQITNDCGPATVVMVLKAMGPFVWAKFEAAVAAWDDPFAGTTKTRTLQKQLDFVRKQGFRDEKRTPVHHKKPDGEAAADTFNSRPLTIEEVKTCLVATLKTLGAPDSAIEWGLTKFTSNDVQAKDPKPIVQAFLRANCCGGTAAIVLGNPQPGKDADKTWGWGGTDDRDANRNMNHHSVSEAGGGHFVLVWREEFRDESYIVMDPSWTKPRDPMPLDEVVTFILAFKGTFHMLSVAFQALAQYVPAPTMASGGTLQRKAEASAQDAGDVHAIAHAGVGEPGAALPHLDLIQRSFGKHDVRKVEAHTGPAAQHASRKIGARAYAMGEHVAFDGAPDLHTAAHEAAHVVQQRKGVHLSGGVGTAGDPYERHADAVADKVVANESAEELLDQVSGGATIARAVQRDSGGGKPGPGGGAQGGAQPGNAPSAPPPSGTRCFIDSDDGANLHAEPAFDSPSITGPDGTSGPPLSAGKEVIFVGVAREPAFWKVSTDVAGVVTSGYIQAARIAELREDPMAGLFTVPSGAQALDLANKLFGHQVQDGLDLRFYANVLYWLNEAKLHRGALTGDYFPNGTIQLVAGKRMWLVTPQYALAQRDNPAIPHGSRTGGAVAKVQRFKGELEDLTSSVRDAPNYFLEVAAEEAKAIEEHLGEIIATTVAFILAEEASMVLAASGAGAPVALVIQMLLTLFGAAMVVKSVESAVRDGIAWFTEAWNANGDPAALHDASKSFLRMLVAIAVAVLAAKGTANQASKTLSLASRIRRSVVSNSASEAAGETGQQTGAGGGTLGAATVGEDWSNLAGGPQGATWKVKIGFSDGQPRIFHDTQGNLDPNDLGSPAPAMGPDRMSFLTAGKALHDPGVGFVVIMAPNGIRYAFVHFLEGRWSVPDIYEFAQQVDRIACCYPCQAKLALADVIEAQGFTEQDALAWANKVIIGDWSVPTAYYPSVKDWTMWLGVGNRK